MPTLIDNLHSDASQLLKQLAEAGDLSMHSFANENLRKVLLLSAASWFETRISEAMLKFAEVHSNGHPGIQSLIKKKAVDRQYHTYFDWKNGKPGPFYGLFGDICSKLMSTEISGDAKLKDGLAAFLELGSLRNELVHENFAAFPFNKTADEVYALYQKAENFITFLERRLPEPAFGRPLSASTAMPCMPGEVGGVGSEAAVRMKVERMTVEDGEDSAVR